MNDLRVLLTSWPDQDDLVAEIWWGNQYIADIRTVGDDFVITFRPTEDAVPVQVKLDDLKLTLDEARRALER